MSLLSLINFGNAVFLAVATAALLVKNPVIKVGIIAVAALLLKFRPGIDVDNLVFAASALSAVVLERILPFRRNVNAWVAGVFAFALFNAILLLV